MVGSIYTSYHLAIEDPTREQQRMLPSTNSKPALSLARAKPLLLQTLDAAGSHVFRLAELRQIIAQHREEWRLDESVSTTDVIDFLLALRRSPLRKVRLEFAWRPEVRYLWREPHVFDLAMSLQPRGYLSHFTALHLHGLTEQVPRTIYLNHEQRRRVKPATPLSQEAIDFAFRAKPRVSQNTVQVGEHMICILNSMGVGNLGVVEFAGPSGSSLRVTDTERTLIDVAVRPIYAGGVHTVLGAYRRARGAVSVTKLRSMLAEMDYVYPYHQVIGFYLARVGTYSEQEIALFRNGEFRFDFYLAHGLRDPAYSPEWRLFHPQGL
jgi:hypothetical protein